MPLPVTNPRTLWVPQNPEATVMHQFMSKLNEKHGLQLRTYEELHSYSTSNLSQFWSEWFQYASLIHAGSYSQAIDVNLPMSTVPRWFSGVTLNFAENVLFSRDSDADRGLRGTRGKEDGKVAVTEVHEGGVEVNDFTWAQLRTDAAALASALKAVGLGSGDRVFVSGSNSYTTLIVFLATSWTGAIFASTSPDLGVQGILQRVSQIKPKLIFMDNAARYNGQIFSLMPKIKAVASQLSKEPTFQKLIIIPRLAKSANINDIPRCEPLDQFLSYGQRGIPPIKRLPFHAPCLISYSSGTTGEPKCIVHSVGALVLNALKEGVLHGDSNSETTLLQFTTTGWIMYLACVAVLIPGGRTVLYDGSPFFPNPMSFIKLLETQKVTSFGTSPRWMTEIRNLGISPKKVANLSSLESVSSTGMVLSDQLFEWFYDEAFPSRVRLGNMSGGTDIAGCFALGNPISPVYVGGCQGPALGVAIGVYDPETAGGKGVAVTPGSSGELVAYKPFPNLPVFFWNDGHPTSRKSRYFSSYFSKYDNVWAQGDFVSIHPVSKAIIFHGRADGVLNPSGIRFGSSEIYSVLERHFSDVIEDSICVGQRRPQDVDERVLLFIKMKKDQKYSPLIEQRLKQAIKKDLSSRHVPKHVFEVPDIPVTATFKKVELPVKHIVSGKTIEPSSTIVNPQSLDFFHQFADLENIVSKAKL